MIKKTIAISLFFASPIFLVAIFNNQALAGSATLTWNANTEPDLAGYKIYYGTSSRTGSCPPGGYPNVLSVGKITSYTLNNLADGQTWYFSLTAYDSSNNESCFSAEVSKFLFAPGDTIPPTVPSNLLATVISSSQINLSWSASTDNVAVAGYRIYRGGVQIATTTGTTYSNTDLSPSTTYSYTVAAYDAAGNVSNQSPAVSATTSAAPDATPPASISNLSISNIAQTSLRLNWTAPGDDGSVGTATSYDIRYSTSTITSSNWGSATRVSGEPTPAVAGTAQTMTISGLSAVTTYYFAIRTTDDAGNISGLSNVVSGTTQSFTLTATLTASPNVGISSLSNVSLTATVGGSQIGSINYTFYCNRSDSGTNITTPYDGKFDNQTATTYTADNICSYSTPGTYSAKVIVERGIMATENRVIIVVNVASDIIPPTVSISSPTNGATISGTVTISANASDNIGVAGVQFKLDGINLGPEGASSPYSISWDTTTASNGSHNLTATARDTSGNQKISSVITVNINNAATQIVYICSDGLDNDNDGLIDYPSDPGCSSTTDDNEYNAPVSIGGGSGGGVLTDTAPPASPSNSSILKSGNQVIISWTNPLDQDFKGVMIVRKENSAPSSRTDGIIVYNNNLQSFVDIYIDSFKTYYYALYSYDNNNNYSQPAILKLEQGQAQVISQPTTQKVTTPTAPTVPTAGTGTTAPTTGTTTPITLIVPPTISSSYQFSRYLSIGKSGDDVKKLQEILAANPIIYPEGLVTGYYGPATQRAVQKFQEIYNLATPSTPGYGIVGSSTREKLNQLISYKTTPISAATSTPEQSKRALIAKLKALIAQLEAQILVLLEQLKKLKAGQR